MATLQAARAIALGYDEDTAKSFGLNRAIFYAAAKRGFKGKSNKQLGKTLDLNEAGKKQTVTLDIESVGNEQAFCIHKNGQLYFVIGDEILDKDDFERQIEKRFIGKYNQVWHQAIKIVESYNQDILESQRKFYDEVYEPRRDILAKEWSELVK